MSHTGYVKKPQPCTICGTIMDTVFEVVIDKRKIHVVACSLKHANMILSGQRKKEKKR
jgi:hypothetical protein